MIFGKGVATASAGGAVLVLAACGGGGAARDDPGRGGVAPMPTAATAAESGQSLETIGKGYWVFQRKCSECHVAKLPADPHQAGWHATVAGMSWNAGLMKSEETALLAYIGAVKP